MLEIKNNHLHVQINLLGAEVRSVKNVDNNHEYMWSGDSDFWAGVSPVLFPVVGKSTNGKIKYHGKEYSMGNHGLARHTIFDVVEHNENSITLSMKTTEQNYPFELRLDVTYTLDNNKLVTTFAVKNLGGETASCGFGAHPAFACPFDNTHNYDDYEVTFGSKENLVFHPLNLEAFYLSETKQTELSKIELDSHTFDNDALVYSDFTSKKVRVAEKNSKRYIEVIFDGFEYLGVWSKPKANASYVCIEPWCGRADILDFDGDIVKRSGNVSINPKDTFIRSYSIEFGY